MTKETATKRTTQKTPKAELEINRSRMETLNRLSAVESVLSISRQRSLRPLPKQTSITREWRRPSKRNTRGR